MFRLELDAGDLRARLATPTRGGVIPDDVAEVPDVSRLQWPLIRKRELGDKNRAKLLLTNWLTVGAEEIHCNLDAR